MSNQEFSNEFDILYNNIMSNAAPGLDEYEKSVFLTKAQDEIVKNYFNPKGNKYQEGIDDSSKRQMDYSSLVTIKEPVKINPVTSNYVLFDERSLLYQMPEDIMFILNETGSIIKDNIKTSLNIIPISFTEYTRLTSKPWGLPRKTQGWRLIQTNSNAVRNTDHLVEIIVKDSKEFSGYKIRYVRKPKPIILVNLKDIDSTLTINGLSTISECELDPIIHSEILQRAVELAKNSFYGNLETDIKLGNRSE